MSDKNTHLPRPSEAEIETLARALYAQRQAEERAKELEAEQRRVEREEALKDMRSATKRLFKTVGTSPKKAFDSTVEWISEAKDELEERREQARIAAEAERIHQERVMDELRDEAKARLEEERAAKQAKKETEEAS